NIAQRATVTEPGAVATGSFRSKRKDCVISHKSCVEDPVATALGSSNLLQLFVFLTRDDQDRNRGVGLFPQREEILIGAARFCRVTFDYGCARHSELCQRIHRS